MRLQSGSARFLAVGLLLGGALVIARSAESASDKANPVLSSEVPADVTPTENPTQADLHHHGWRLFVAMNWPTAGGQPRAESIGSSPNDLRLWETFADPTMFLELKEGITRREPETPTGRALNAEFFLQDGSDLPVVDKTLNFLVNEFVVNPTIVDFTLENGLVSNAGFVEYAKTHDALSLPNGSIEVKASWRIFPEDTADATLARYHIRNATISIPAEESASGDAFVIDNATVGLVGLHIIQKTPSHPKWVWSTFEHVDLYEGSDSVLKIGTEGALESNRAPALASTGEPPKKYLWSDPMQGHTTAADYLAPAVARSPNEFPFPDKLNAAWQAALPAPWSNYRLVATQWTDASGQPRPQNTDGISIAKNSTMETFLLGDQTISLQVPGIDTTNACPKSGDGSTLWAEIEQILDYRGYPKTGRTANTWSSCYMCHQLALYKYGKDDKDVIQTDYSFAYKSVLPVIPCTGSKF